MVYREIQVGFFFSCGNSINSGSGGVFPVAISNRYAAWLLVPVQAAMAPLIAIITYIGSMGNGPLTAVLANNGILLGAIMAQLYADFNVSPAVKINATYYG